MQLVLHTADPDTLGVFEDLVPIEGFARLFDGIVARSIDGDWIGRGEYADIGGNAPHGTGFAVTAAGDIQRKIDVDVFFAVAGGISVFSQFFTEEFSLEKPLPDPFQRKDRYGMVRTNGKTCSAAEALCMVDMRSAVDRNDIDFFLMLPCFLIFRML